MLRDSEMAQILYLEWIRSVTEKVFKATDVDTDRNTETQTMLKHAQTTGKRIF